MLNYLEKSRLVLGMNARNLLYVRPYNPKEARKIADDKMLSKKALMKSNLPVPNLIARIRSLKELETFDWDQLPYSFVLKPNRGLGGEGIVVVYGRNKKTGNWVKADKREVTVEDLKLHIRNIFEGTYSLSNQPDKIGRASCRERV